MNRFTRIGSENRDGIDGPPYREAPRPLLTEIAKRVCNTLRLTPLIPAHRTKVAVTKTTAIPQSPSDRALSDLGLPPAF